MATITLIGGPYDRTDIEVADHEVRYPYREVPEPLPELAQDWAVPYRDYNPEEVAPLRTLRYRVVPVRYPEEWGTERIFYLGYIESELTTKAAVHLLHEHLMRTKS